MALQAPLGGDGYTNLDRAFGSSSLNEVDHINTLTLTESALSLFAIGVY
jgi:hypothetical protein